MTDRRRNLAVLLLVGLMLVGSVVAIAAKTTRLGLDLKGGVELVYQAKATKFSAVTADAVNRSIEIMRKRVDALGVAEPEIQRSGADQISVSLPDVKNAAQAAAQVGTTAQLFFYDWEKNVLGPDCKPAPTNFSVTGGPSAGSAGALSQYDALARARRCPPVTTGIQSATQTKYYLVDTRTKKVLAGPEDKPSDLKGAAGATANGPIQVWKVNPGTVVVQAESPSTSTSSDKTAKKGPDAYYVLRDDFALRGTDITNPEQNFDQNTQAPNVTFDFTSSGRKKWQQTTQQIAQRGSNFVATSDGQVVSNAQQKFQHFAIVLDNQLISVPYIDYQQNPNGIDGANGSEISGGFTIGSAQALANQLKYGALPVNLELISQSQVSATLGKEALHQGLIAGIVGFAIVAIFLLVFYRLLGVIAVGALVVYAIYLFALIKLIPITLTLPGIAGLILTVGVAADANIVIFERVKEEIRAGRSVPAGIAAGYRKGLAAIIDANVVTFMVAFILFVLSTAGVKGFAFVLGIGTLVSLFTAILLTQAVLGTMARSSLITHPAALGFRKGRKMPWEGFDFMGASKWFFSFSGVILLIGALAIGGKGLKFGIDFESGTRVRAELVKPADENGIRKAIASTPAGGAAEVQRITDKSLGSNAFQISTAELKPSQVSEVTQALQSSYGIKGQPDTQSIGPTFGNTVAKGAVIAVIVSLLVISAYIALRFEWKYAVPVVIALAHDLLITAGVYSLTGREVTTSTIAALLTILGYSLYDTIIVFDRVRENVPRMPRAAFSQIVNRSMTEVLTRSLATSFSTALPILALLLFGGQTLKDFAFALLVGTVSGAYSSIFIASPVLTHWKEREPVYERRSARIRREFGGLVPAYAGSTAGEPTDVAPSESKARPSIFAPDDPSKGVSRTEFDSMVEDLHADAPRRGTATREHEPEPEPEPDPTADLTPEDLVIKDPKRRDKPKRPRNSRHGRPR
jgi:SecD/SecF fusion protein